MTTDKSLFFCASLLIFLGILMSYSLSTYTTVVLYHYGEFHFFIRQLLSAIMGIVIMWGLSRVDPSKWFGRLGFFLLFIPLLLIIGMFFCQKAFLVALVGRSDGFVWGFSLSHPWSF